ncbi:MAG: polyphosphate kinase 1 [Bacteroidota bacterium]
MGRYQYFNRDISWLAFNHRVLEEAYDKSLPLYERIKFLAIYSNNLEEFYRVRVSYYRSLIRELPADHPKIEEVDPASIMNKINHIVSRHQAEFNELFYNQIIPELRKNGIIIKEYGDELNPEQEDYIKTTFLHVILTSVQPVLLVKHRIKPFLKTGHVYIVTEMYSKLKKFGRTIKGKRAHYGLIKLPTDHGISRFIELPGDENYYIMFLEDMIMKHIGYLYPGYYIDAWHSIKITRDADLEFEDYENEDLIEIIEQLENRRAIGEPNRFQYDARLPRRTLNFLIENFDFSRDNLVQGGKRHNFRDFFLFPNPVSPNLEHDKFNPLPLPELEGRSMFESIQEKEYMLHFPYQSFEYFIRFLNEAAKDDEVIEIKSTQYRVASDSAVVDALIKAALNGKKVSVFVELKARFDEEANLQYAREMRQAGIQIMYGIPGLKVHAKMALVMRKSGKDMAFLGTGNFNEKTAKLYCDHGFFTSRQVMIDDVKTLFRYLEDQQVKPTFKHILVPGFNMVEHFKSLIDREINHVKKGKKGYMILKMNGLEDPVMIDKLYQASENGVKVDCIVRGICRLIPGQKFSKNIRVIRIVDRFLEHARVFWFQNDGNDEIYLGSADWMKRNLYRRIENIFPVYDKNIKAEMLDILNIQLNDNAKGRLIGPKLENLKFQGDEKPVRSQQATYEYLLSKYL